MGSLKAGDAVLLDSNILIDFLSGHAEAKALLAELKAPVISVVSWIEVLAGAADAEEGRTLKEFLGHWPVVMIDLGIAQQAAVVRREQRMKLPDAIVLATAIQQRRKLVTRNTKDFDAGEPDIVVPYQLGKPSSH